MSDTPNLALTLLDAAQAQKHVTVNEALTELDALVQLAVLDRDLTAPPGTPAEGDRYIVAATATGAWAGKENNIAVWRSGAWAFHAAKEGWLSYVTDEDALLVWNGTAWVAVTSGSATELQNITLFGLGTTADATNPFTAKLNKALWTAKTVAEGGDGDLRYTMNKEAAADVLSLLLQTGFSARAELGLIGDDDFVIKVSADGTVFNEGLRIDKDTGAVTFPNSSIGGGSATLVAPQGRLTLVSGEAVMLADQTAKTSVFWTPYGGRSFPRWSGAAFAMVDAGGELTLNLASNAGFTGYHQQDKNFDVFAALNGATPVIGTGPAWTSDTARGTGAGTTELELLHGFHVNKNQITLRLGALSGDTISVPAREATYLGTMRASANGQTEFEMRPAAAVNPEANLFLWNAYNRVPVSAVIRDNTNFWDYASTTWRRANGGGNLIRYIDGLARSAVKPRYIVPCYSPNAGQTGGNAGCARDWTSGAPPLCGVYYNLDGANTGAAATITACDALAPAMGLHSIDAVESGHNTNGVRFYGDSWSGASGQVQALIAELEM